MDSAKAALRRVMKARIAALDAAYDKAAGEGIVRRLTAHPAWAGADSGFCYVGRRGEVDARTGLRAAVEERNGKLEDGYKKGVRRAKRWPYRCAWGRA